MTVGDDERVRLARLDRNALRQLLMVQLSDSGIAEIQILLVQKLALGSISFTKSHRELAAIRRQADRIDVSVSGRNEGLSRPLARIEFDDDRCIAGRLDFHIHVFGGRHRCKT